MRNNETGLGQNEIHAVLAAAFPLPPSGFDFDALVGVHEEDEPLEEVGELELARAMWVLS